MKGLDSWDEGHVLTFLKQHYSRDNLLDTYSADQGDSGEGGPLARGEEEEKRLTPPEKSYGDRDSQSVRPPSALGPRPALPESLRHRLDVRFQSLDGPEVHKQVEVAVPFLGVGFSSLDMSLCVVLYVASSLFLMVMYFFFRVRSRRWKVKYHHPAV
ncbi:Sulfhydryl oxidase 2 [Saguinus oedipus]|uniref:Sulfhydryl oxidase 2 n=1 Tax=Saguinus oedipus TaxID=9490 RepID=A0ABQ9WI46_SAGOE|nr:Sulfhydryl oxidase 2 [Saguinus oedipus]